MPLPHRSSCLAPLLWAAAIPGLALLFAIAAAASLARSESSAQPAGSPAGIPAVYVPVYRAAGEQFGVSWLLLASIHRQETDFSRSGLPGVQDGANGCGAAGPMQFGIVGVAGYRAGAPSCGALTGTGAGNTWARYAHAARRLPDESRPASYPLMRTQLPGCEPIPVRTGCVYDDVDAIAAAAMYLHELGARLELDEAAWQAARRYNGAAAYADAVLARARTWQTQAADDLAAADPQTASVPGGRARLGADGLARAPENAPEAVRGAIAAANAISNRPYLLRHYPTHLDNPTYDCSSSVSHALWGAGVFGTAPWVSGQLERYGRPGPGRWITIYANAGHTFMTIAGLRFDTGRYDTGPNAGESGPRFRLGPRPTANFVVRHPPGL